jgi:hypothetical protein
MLLLTYFILPAHYRRPVPSAAEYSLPCKGIFFGSLKSMNACRQFKSEHLPYCQQYGHNGELVNEGRYITQLMQTKSRSNVPLGKPLDAVTATNGPLTRHRLSAHRLFRNIPNAKQNENGDSLLMLPSRTGGCMKSRLLHERGGLRPAGACTKNPF